MGGDVRTAASVARRAETAGFESVWTTEFYDRSAIVTLAAMAEATESIGLASGIAYGLARTPLVLAVEARDIDELSAGRLTLGLGTGTARMQSDWHGMDPSHPAPRMEELVPLLRELWSLDRQAVDHVGRFYRCRIQPTVRFERTRSAPIPVYLAGVRPRMIEAAGAVADGLVGHPLATPEYIEQVARPALERGARRTGREPHVPVAGYVICAIHDSEAVARSEAAAQIGFYATVKAYDPILELHGFEVEGRAIREAWHEGDHEAMAAAVSERMLEAMAVWGTPKQARERFARRFEGVYDAPLLYSPSFGLSSERLADNLEAICEAFAV